MVGLSYFFLDPRRWDPRNEPLRSRTGLVLSTKGVLNARLEEVRARHLSNTCSAPLRGTAPHQLLCIQEGQVARHFQYSSLPVRSSWKRGSLHWFLDQAHMLLGPAFRAWWNSSDYSMTRNTPSVVSSQPKRSCCQSAFGEAPCLSLDHSCCLVLAVVQPSKIFLEMPGQGTALPVPSCVGSSQ